MSTQVLNELYVVATRRLTSPLPIDEASEMVEAMALLNCVPVDAGLVRAAIGIGQRWQLSHWDELMVAAARYEDVRIENPFRDR